MAHSEDSSAELSSLSSVCDASASEKNNSVKSSSEKNPELDADRTQTAAPDQRKRSYACSDFTIEGYSRAAVQTFWRLPEMKLGFDLGWQPWEYMGTPRWFLSHTHMDHCLALPAYVARRRMMKMTPPVIYVPACMVDAVRQLLAVYVRLDRGKLPCQLIGVSDGDEIELSRELVVTVSKTFHTVPSVGYLVWERRKKLKPEFQSCTGDLIRDLRLAGTEVTNEFRYPKVAYLGDSTPEGLDYNPDMYKAEALITEMTFVSPDHRRDAIKKFGHTHLDDFLARRDRFENKVIIAGHFSTRCTDKQIRYYIRKRCPDLLGGRLKIWL